MYKIKVYKYDSSQEENGYRGTGENAFIDNVSLGTELDEDVTQELDASEITLRGLPFQNAFDPETKFIIDLVEETNNNGTIEEVIKQTIHRCVLRDVPNKPILSDDHYFDHHISFIEPSVVAQKRLVDNISATYKLKDVTLKESPAFDTKDTDFNNEPSIYEPSKNFGRKRSVGFTEKITWVWGKYFQFDGVIEMLKRDGTPYRRKYLSIEDFQTEDGYRAKFSIPKLAIYGGLENTKEFGFLGYASIDYLIEEFSLTNSSNPTNSWEGSIISNSNLADNKDYYSLIDYSEIEPEWLFEGVQTQAGYGGSETYVYGAKKYTETSANTPSYITQEIPISTDKQYKVTISIHEFDDNFVGANNCVKYTGSEINRFVYRYEQLSISSNALLSYEYSPQAMPLSQTTGSSTFVTYNVDTGTLVYSSSKPYSALSLLQKAIINSSIYEKKDGVYIADVNNSNLPFYIDDKFINELMQTTIIENFYNQKNLWEILIEVGHYIHAIPELVFGNDDRFMITFSRLGRTDEKPDNGTKVSIFNSRSVEDYISASSSYITNMVQLGGYIEEWVVPKTTNEQLLVYNDTAELIVSKPIIELLSITVKRNSDGATADLTKFIYEENVYKTLGINYDVVPNRGIAMYYSLGSNIITGGNYQLPQANTNIYTDYSFKKVIYCAFNGYPIITPLPTSGYWTDYQISDYSFLIRYRTKDSVRQNHIRPDLRKYLLNSKHDRYPEHNQFNNQTDVVADSVKFGNSMYGNLIKTGNNSYTITEWTDDYNELKHKGELYRINGELYYVAKVKHTIYGTHFVSQITYSKDYNELSKIIGIPSEPRFYEISEQSLIWREFQINDVLLLTDDEEQIEYKSNYVFNSNHLADLVLGEGTSFAKYAVTVYKGDKDSGKYNQTIGEPNLYIEVINPVNAYSSENTLTYEWDMADNYSAGDKVVPTKKEFYNSLSAVKYTDIYGKAELMDFYILGDVGILTTDEIKALPESPISSRQEENKIFIGNCDILATNVKEFDTNYNGRGIGLLKDCREALSNNYNLQLLTSSDTFVLSPFVFSPQKRNVRIALLSNEVNKLSTGYISNNEIITPLDKNGNKLSPYFEFTIDKTEQTSSWDTDKKVVTRFGINLKDILKDVADEHFIDAQDYQRVKSIAVLCDASIDVGIESSVASKLPYKTQFIIARNIPQDWDREKASSPIYFGAPNKNNVFKNKQ